MYVVVSHNLRCLHKLNDGSNTTTSSKMQVIFSGGGGGEVRESMWLLLVSCRTPKHIARALQRERAQRGQRTGYHAYIMSEIVAVEAKNAGLAINRSRVAGRDKV